MARKWSDEEVKAEIAAAIKIVNEDRERSTYLALHERYGKGDSGSGDSGGNDGGNGPKAPPAKDGSGDGGEPPAKRQSLWWGDALDDE